MPLETSTVITVNNYTGNVDLGPVTTFYGDYVADLNVKPRGMVVRSGNLYISNQVDTFTTVDWATDESKFDLIGISSGGGGTVDSIVAGTGIAVDDTDPANPIVSADIEGLTNPLTADLDTGGFNIETADADGADSNDISILTGNVTTSGISGDIDIRTGSSVGVVGNLNITGGEGIGTAGGYINIKTGDSDGANSGDLTVSTGTGSNASGTLYFYPGSVGEGGTPGDVIVKDAGNNIVAKLANRLLVAADGIVESVNWALRRAYSDESGSGVISVDWQERQLYATNGSSVVLDWSTYLIKDSIGNPSIDWNGRLLSASDNTTVGDFSTAANGFTFPAGITFTGGSIRDASVNKSIDPATRQLYGEDGTTLVASWVSSVFSCELPLRIVAGIKDGDYVNMIGSGRTLIGADGTTVIATWDTTGFGFFDAAPAAQQANIPDPSGGVVSDDEARTAIAAILDLLETFGLMAGP